MARLKMPVTAVPSGETLHSGTSDFPASPSDLLEIYKTDYGAVIA